MVHLFTKAWKYSISALLMHSVPSSTSSCTSQDIALAPSPPAAFPTTWWAAWSLCEVCISLQTWQFSSPIQNSCICLLKVQIYMKLCLLLINHWLNWNTRNGQMLNIRNLRLRDMAASWHLWYLEGCGKLYCTLLKKSPLSMTAICMMSGRICFRRGTPATKMLSMFIKV